MLISLEDAHVRIASRHGFNLVQRFSHPMEGVRNALRTEEILFLRRTYTAFAALISTTFRPVLLHAASSFARNP